MLFGGLIALLQVRLGSDRDNLRRWCHSELLVAALRRIRFEAGIRLDESQSTSTAALRSFKLRCIVAFLGGCGGVSRQRGDHLLLLHLLNDTLDRSSCLAATTALKMLIIGHLNLDVSVVNRGHLFV